MAAVALGLAWPSALAHVGAALWLIAALLGLHVLGCSWPRAMTTVSTVTTTTTTTCMPKAAKTLNNTGGDPNHRPAAQVVRVLEVPRRQLRRGGRLIVAPAVTPRRPIRSVDIRPMPVLAAMRVRYVRLSPWFSALAPKTAATATTTTSTATTTSTTSPIKSRSATAFTPAPVHSTGFVENDHTASVPTPTAVPKARVQPLEQMQMKTAQGPTAGFRWTGLAASTWLLVVLISLVIVASNVQVATAEVVTEGLSFPMGATRDLYVVLVSIPVLDKVLPLKNLAGELLHRGFRVGFALPENCRHWVSDLEQLEFISLGSMVGKGRGTFLAFEELESMGVYESYASTLRYYASFQRPMFNPLVEDLEEDRPDLVIVDRYTFAGFDACQALGIPFIVNNPFMLMDIDSPPAHVPAPFSNITIHTTSVLERCFNSFHRLRFRLVMVQVLNDVNAVRGDNGLPPIEHKDDIIGDKLVLVNSVFGWDEARPIAPQFPMIGMLEQTIPMKALLPMGYERWLSSDISGWPIIFVSFPADVPLSPEFVTTLMNGLEEVQARIVWKISLQEQAAFDLRTRSRSTMYFLREDVTEAVILDYTHVSLLISPGDYYSVQQAVSIGIPVLGLPFSAEQWETVNKLVFLGVGLQLQASTFTEDRIHAAVLDLLWKPKYMVSALYHGELLKTGGGTIRAADHVTSVADFGTAHVLPARNLQPLYKTFLVDVYVVYGFILCCSAVILRTLFSVLYSIFQIAPDVHLGVTLDDGPEVAAGHHDHDPVHKDKVL